ncbi:hypothetical protein SIN01_18600 [Sporolactobacillus inulinus]|nr:hypothetical protein SIN01_18600 [Sporolactobacillus inulinus]
MIVTNKYKKKFRFRSIFFLITKAATAIAKPITSTSFDWSNEFVIVVEYKKKYTVNIKNENFIKDE